MDARLDSTFESAGRFWLPNESTTIPGRLRYDPKKGIELELVLPSTGVPVNNQALDAMFGTLVDGTHVTVIGLLFKNASLGMGMGGTTILQVQRAMCGGHIADADRLLVKRYSTELSSLANWTCMSPVELKLIQVDGTSNGFDLIGRRLSPIRVTIPNHPFEIEIRHAMETHLTSSSFSASWSAAITVVAQDILPVIEMQKIAWQCQHFMSLLVGDQLSIRMITMAAVGTIDTRTEEQTLKMVYEQVGKADQEDVHPARMLLPYDTVREEFAGMLENWFERSEQMILAANVFFGSQSVRSESVNVKFLEAAQSVESYHRSLGTGLYMSQADFDRAIQELTTHLPNAIEGDHRHSLKNRLKYGNEFSLRKRLAEMFNRLPDTLRLRIAGDVPKFIGKVVDTRNYYTHYDHAAQANAFDGGDAFVAAERLTVLVVANLLYDLGIEGESLSGVIERHNRFQHWMSQALTF